MTAHELAKVLLDGPDFVVYVRGNYSPDPLNSAAEISIPHVTVRTMKYSDVEEEATIFNPDDHRFIGYVSAEHILLIDTRG